jgi:hypothetical protein
MPSTQDQAVATRFSRARDEARQHLRREMERMGLRAADGWRIHETIRPVQGGSELMLRPMHFHQPTPAGIECIVAIDETAEIETQCEP